MVVQCALGAGSKKPRMTKIEVPVRILQEERARWGPGPQQIVDAQREVEASKL
eukprot:CAMPEP_0118943568 /NCGR_PEP_ID=MMETSP1169-20130426/38594_1 /TAXON_ID=36882 /ORGANISM="Pyramimonas obovata, Strain CCMP722" /LENGTH=52 /DNA_ID=CAMNT_0006888857 /DNA_START=69 /DNA_END=223 /DNA_ORIENTATION=-